MRETVRPRAAYRTWNVALAAAALCVAATGCSDSNPGTTPPAEDMAVAVVDMAMPPPAPDLSTPPLSDLAGSPVTRLSVGFEQPTGVYFDTTSNAWYVSNYSGQLPSAGPSALTTIRDNKGWITKISADYATVDHNWYRPATGQLSAPLGLRGMGTKLYVGDVDNLVTIDVPTQMAVRSAALPMEFIIIQQLPSIISDVAVDSTGAVYATSITGNKIWKFATPNVAGSSGVRLGNAAVQAPTGILVDGTKLVVTDSGSLLVQGSTGNVWTMNLADGLGSAKLGTFAAKFQGVEKDGTGYLVAVGADKTVYKVDGTSGAQTVAYNFGNAGAQSLGDVGWNPATRTVGVVDPAQNTVYFFKLP